MTDLVRALPARKNKSSLGEGLYGAPHMAVFTLCGEWVRHLGPHSGAIDEADTKNPGKPFPARGPELLASADRFMTGGVS
jgi:hypothetical protein